MFIGTGMALGRATAETLLFKRYGIENLPYVFILLSFFLALISLLYAAFSDRIRSEVFFNFLALGTILLLSVIWVVIQFSDSTSTYAAFFIVYEVISELFLVHCSFYLAQNITSQQSKRLLPLIMAGNQLGVLFGGLMLPLLVKYISVDNIIFVWSAILLTSVFFTSFWHKTYGPSPYYKSKPKKGKKIKQATDEIFSAYKFTKSSPFLRANSFALFFMVISFYLLYYVINSIYTKTFTTEASLASFLGYVTALTGILTLLIQIFLTNKLLNKYNIKTLNYIYPVTTLSSFIALTFFPGLITAIAGSINKDTLTNSIRSPVQAIFYNALPAHIQGRCRALSIVIIIPLALLFCAAIIIYSKQNDSFLFFCIAGIISSIFLLSHTKSMNLHYFNSIYNVITQRFHFNNKTFMNENFKPSFRESNNEDNSYNNEIQCATIKLLISSHPELAVKFLADNYKRLSTATLDIILTELSNKNINAPALVYSLLEQGDKHLQASIINLLVNSNDMQCVSLLKKGIKSNNPRLKAISIQGIIKMDVKEEIEYSLNALKPMFETDTYTQINALSIADIFNYLQYESCHDVVDAYLQTITSFLSGKDEVKLCAALKSLAKIRYINEPGTLFPLISKLFNHPSARVRNLTVMCTTLFNTEQQSLLLQKVLHSRNSQNISTCVNMILYGTHNRADTIRNILTNPHYLVHPASSQILLQCICEKGIAKNELITYAESFASDAIHYLEISHLLTGISPAHKSYAHNISIIAAHERARDYCALALTALGYIEDYTEFSSIYAAAINGDANYSAQALELLHQSSQKEIARNITRVIQNDPGKDTNMTFQQVLSWIEIKNDQWLQSCLEKVSKEIAA